MVRNGRRLALKDALADLKRYRQRYSLDELLTSRDVQRLIMHALYVAVQASIDEAVAICKERGVPAGDRYRDAFLALGQAGLLEPEHSARLADWASFRNVLAHFYPVIDLRRVHSALDDIGYLEEFADWVTTYDSETT